MIVATDRLGWGDTVGSTVGTSALAGLATPGVGSGVAAGIGGLGACKLVPGGSSGDCAGAVTGGAIADVVLVGGSSAVLFGGFSTCELVVGGSSGELTGVATGGVSARLAVGGIDANPVGNGRARTEGLARLGGSDEDVAGGLESAFEELLSR